MVIARPTGVGNAPPMTHPIARLPYHTIWITLLSLVLVSCAPVRPVVKIGLLAPFEGLYRRTGYQALEAMRAALSEAAPAAMDFMPLALDASADVERSAQKLLADPSVGAVIGPFTPQAVSQAQAAVADAGAPWLIPFALDPGASLAPSQAVAQWLRALIGASQELAQMQGAQRLVVVGLPPAWLAHTPQGEMNPGEMPVLYQLAGQDDLSMVAVTDAILHLGEPAAVAAYLRTLRADHAAALFLIGVQGDDPVFAELSEHFAAVYWAAWIDDGYDAWAATQAAPSPLAYQVYVATKSAIAGLAHQPNPAETTWTIRWYESTR